MSRFLRLVAALVVVAVSLVSTGKPALACSCVMPSDPPAALQDADAVFVGQAIAAIDTNPSPLISSADEIRTTFQVQRTWKGPNQSSLVVTSARNDASCGFRFQVGTDYFVYANTQNGNLTTSICSRTAQLAQAQQDLNALGGGQAVIPTVPTYPAVTTILVVGGAAAAVLFLALLGGGIFLAQRRDNAK